jgi:YD repeat-containing protein
MRRAGDAFVAVNPLRPVSVSDQLSGGAMVGAGGLRLIPLGTDVLGSILSGERVFFANIARDTDAIIEPMIEGADFSTMLRSRLSPETIAYRVVLPAGDVLQADGGGAVVARGGQTIAQVPAPNALDAQGTSVPVQMRVVGDNLILTVEHRLGNFAYPILVDPELDYTIDKHSTNWGFYTQSIGSGTGSCEGKKGPLRDEYSVECPLPSLFSYSVGSGGLSMTMPSVTLPFLVDEAEVNGGIAELYWLSSIRGYVENVEFDGVKSSNANITIDACERTVSWGSEEPLPSSVRITPRHLDDCVYAPVVVVMEVRSGAGKYGLNSKLEWVLEGGTASVSGSVSVGAIIVKTLMSSADSKQIEAEEFGTANQAEPDRSYCLLGHPVNCATGNQVETQTDLSVGGRGPALSLTRTYNSQLAAKQASPGPFGYGWSDSFDARLSTSLPCPEDLSLEPEEESEEIDGLLVGDCEQAAKVEQGDGSSAVFIQNKAGEWLPLDRQNEAKLTYHEGKYLYTLPDQTVQAFDSKGFMASETDRNGNELTMSRGAEGKLEAVTDSSGRKITFAYNSKGQVESATDPLGDTVNYTYEDGNLFSVTEPGESKPRWQFKYNSHHELTEMTDGRGGTVTTEYEDGRVISQTDALGRKRRWVYESPSSGPETDITEPNGSETCEQFAGNGEPISVTHACGTSENRSPLIITMKPAISTKRSILTGIKRPTHMMKLVTVQAKRTLSGIRLNGRTTQITMSRA